MISRHWGLIIWLYAAYLPQNIALGVVYKSKCVFKKTAKFESFNTLFKFAALV
jgi:hypothetical protein